MTEPPPPSSPPLPRRAFLARTGVLGAGAGLAGGHGRAAAAPVPGVEELIGLVRPVLARLALDTFRGLAAFALPGDDAYSRAQGTPRGRAGGVAAGAGELVVASLDRFVPFPQEVARPLTMALVTATAEAGIELPRHLPSELGRLDAALRLLLRGDEKIPLSLVAAVLLGLLAAQVNPAAAGPFLSPFSRLSYRDKARAFELLEHTDSDLVALLDTHLPQPLRGSVSGLLKYLGSGLLSLAAFGCFTEHAVWDAARRDITALPVGWRLTGYDGRADGLDDFKGYYQGRKEAVGRA
ncbi:hypothetical protein ADK76_01875 [Streptomyces griseoflavus]|uniref:hypothetical protein n=1 Tax=Streptomyces rimosus TaxID=1927 RepID=UPI0004C6F8B0|nr:hypothetical protein [Streptomyces rimosus]KOG66610.1 hypothetical protein ADK76_01875 [Streptomyces griseoflavus]